MASADNVQVQEPDMAKANQLADEIRALLSRYDVATSLTAMAHVLGDVVFVFDGNAEAIFPTLRDIAERSARSRKRKVQAEAAGCEGTA